MSNTHKREKTLFPRVTDFARMYQSGSVAPSLIECLLYMQATSYLNNYVETVKLM